MSQPNVSILIACFNGENYIDRCLSSCINQTYKDIEILIINDGSTDNSSKMLHDWEAKDKRIRVIDQTNVGLGETRNRLIANSKGRYFTFVDIDDTMPKKAIQRYLQNMKNDDVDIVVGRTYVIYEKNKFKMPFYPSWRFVLNMTNGHYIKSNLCTPWSSLIKKSYFENLNISFLAGRIFEDVGVMTYVFFKAKKFQVIKDVVYEYHRYSNKANNSKLSSFSDNCFKKYNDIYWQMKNLLKYLDSDKMLDGKRNKRYINGLLFQAYPINLFVSNNITTNKKFRYLMRYELSELINSYGINFRFSKTLWKSIGYFYIVAKGRKVLNDGLNHTKNHVYIGTKEQSKYKFVKPASKLSHNRYVFNECSINDVEQLNAKKKYDINLIFKYSELNVEELKVINKEVTRLNALPFLQINDKGFDHMPIEDINDNFFGYFIDVDKQTTKSQIDKIISQIQKLGRERLIFLRGDKKIIQDLKINHKIINGEFYR